MSNHRIATLIDQSLSIVGSILATLYGFRVLGPKPGANDKFDSMYAKWIKHLKWIGPLSIILLLSQLALSAFASSASEDNAESKREAIQALQENISSKGLLAEYDQTIEAPEGFKVLVPQGFTYSKPPGTQFSLVAANDVNGAGTPVFMVYVVKYDGSLDQFIETMKSGLIAKNQTTKFSGTQVTDMGQYRLNRISMSSKRENGYVKGGMLFIEKGGKVFILQYGTREDLFSANASLFEKIIHSFRPT